MATPCASSSAFTAHAVSSICFLISHQPGDEYRRLRRSNLIVRGSRIHDSLNCGKPKCPVACLASRRLSDRVALRALHAIRFAVGNAGKLFNFSFHQLFQVAQRNPKHTFRATHPEPASILQDPKNRVAKQALFGGVRTNMEGRARIRRAGWFPPQSIQPAAIGAHPDVILVISI